MNVNLSNFERYIDNLFDLTIVQKDIGGGITSITFGIRELQTYGICEKMRI